jgi:4'-phosphopantetheinyl transferase
MSTTSTEGTLTRWYIDTRQLSETTETLPLIETLREENQTAAKKYFRLPDRHMSLASSLLKYYYIHRTCRIPWSQVTISRTPKPHQRPCFIPSSQVRADGALIPAIEFNVSHQASLVTLAGCISSSNTAKEEDTAQALFGTPQPSAAPIPSIPQVGIDITCVDEPGRRRDKGPRSAKELSDFVNIFSEVFSQRELNTISQLPQNSTEPPETQIKSRLRVFYAYWALKEAYIKMTGEALLAPWLRELEFTNVVAPSPVASYSASNKWSTPYTGVETWLSGKRVDDVRIELVAFEKDYMVATAARGGVFGISGASNQPDPWRKLVRIDLEEDVRPCATGTCTCLGE